MKSTILDNDLYKFSMSYAYMKLYPEAEGVFQFKDRNNLEWSEENVKDLKELFKGLEERTLTESQLILCKSSISYIPEFYWEWLKGFRFCADSIEVFLDENNHLEILTKPDKMYKCTLYEVPILAIVSEYYSTKLSVGSNPDIAGFRERLANKVKLSNEKWLYFSEFGTRRRYSYDIQDEVVSYLSKYANNCTGTSNVELALKYHIKPIGTMAHEFIMFHAANFGYRMANYQMMEAWISVFQGNLGIALTDTLTTDIFFKNFSLKHAKLFDGLRQDSGDELEFVQKAVQRYKELGIDPLTKTIIFSNSLTMEKYDKIADYCKNKIHFAGHKIPAGIGTSLTNDLGIKTPNFVMKLVKCRMNANQCWIPTIKLSDDLGKHMGDPREIEICQKTLEINAND